jgi:hypothetical protein
MTRQGLATGLGSLVQFWSFQFTFNDFALLTGASGAAATLNLFNILSGPPYNTSTAWALHVGSIVLYVRVKHSVAFSGGGLTGLVVSVGKSGGSNSFFSPNFNIFQAVADGTLQETFATAMGQLSSVTPTVTFTPTGAALQSITAGVVNIDVLVADVTTTNTTPGQTSTQVL